MVSEKVAENRNLTFSTDRLFLYKFSLAAWRWLSGVAVATLEGRAFVIGRSLLVGTLIRHDSRTLGLGVCIACGCSAARDHRNRVLQLEIQRGLGRQHDLLTLGCGRYPCTRTRAHGGTDRSPLATTSESANECTESGASADLRRRSLAARITLLSVLAGMQSVGFSIHLELSQLERQLRAASKTASALRFCNATRNLGPGGNNSGTGFG